MSLAAAKAGRIADLFTIRAAQIKKGAYVPALGVRLPTDAHSMVLMVWMRFYFDANPSTTIDWPAPNFQWIDVTQTKLNQAAQAIIGHIQQCNANTRTIQAQINAATTEAQVLAVPLGAGWPT